MSSLFDSQFAALEAAGWYDVASQGVFLSAKAPESVQEMWRGRSHGDPHDWARMLSECKSDDEVVRCLHYLTVMSHEFRHFHDMVGTTLGAYIFKSNMSAIIDFSLVVSQFPEEAAAHLPLRNWAADPSCPQLIRDFVADYCSRSDFLDWLMSPTSWEPKTALADSLLTRGEHTNTGYPIPVVSPVGLRVAWPVGGRSLFEASALSVQDQIAEEFSKQIGEDFSNRLHKHRLHSVLSKGLYAAWPYVAVELALFESLGMPAGSVATGLLVDVALMPDIFGAPKAGADYDDVHPGLRLLRLADAIRREMPFRNINAFKAALDKFSSKTPSFSAKHAMNSSEASLEEFSSMLSAASPDVQPIFGLLTDAFLGLHSRVLAFRRKHPYSYGNPLDYVAVRTNTDLLPSPPYVIGPFESNGAYDIRTHPSTTILSGSEEVSVSSYWILFSILDSVVRNMVVGDIAETADIFEACPLQFFPGYQSFCSRNVKNCPFSVIAESRLRDLDEWGEAGPSVGCPYEIALGALGFDSSLWS